jgi:hypothetical protein
MRKTRQKEKVLKASWHAAIAAVGIFELERSQSWLSKALSAGLIAFHIDACVCDALDKPTTLQRILRRLS